MSLFAEAGQCLEGKGFSAGVMARTCRRRYVVLSSAAAAILAIGVATWLLLGLPLLEFAVLISRVLATPLFDMGEGWLALVLLPVNTIASVLLFVLKAARMLQKRIFGAIP